MRQLKDIAHIRLRAVINCDEALDLKREFSNYFRLFKNNTETVEDNSFCSPYFAKGDIIPMTENYGDRKSAMNTIVQAMMHGGVTKNSCIGVYLSYDFRLAAVNEDYHTDGEFEHTQKIVEKATNSTDLFVCFMVSHYNQLVGKALTRKPEHYHILLSESKGLSQPEFEENVKRFADNLQSETLDVVMRNGNER